MKNKNHKKSKFIVVEGIDGSGKTNACQIIKHKLDKNQIKNIIVREPGSTPLSEKIRKIIKNHCPYETLHQKTLLLLIYAARMQLIKNKIQPSLKKNIWVIADRHDLSSLAYQGGGFKINKKHIFFLKKMIVGKLTPDLTIYLDIQPKKALHRILFRNQLDFIEKKNLEFFIRTRNMYLKMLSKINKKIFINANLKINIVHHDIINQFTEWLKKYK
ncbi:Thymidylate kinase [Buchnera aphidicola (Panaphis juglandis)]